MKHIVKDFPANIDADKLQMELDKLTEEGYKIKSCDYVRYDYFDLRKMPIFKTFYRVIGEKEVGKSSEQQVLKG
jgi:hypothetical protein